MHLEIDESRCTGHGRCYDIAPELFEPDEYGHGRVTKVGASGTFDRDRALLVVRACPEDAILLAEG